MNSEKAAEELSVIRQLMERPIRYSTMSGVSGIVAGLAALAGTAASAWIWWQDFPGEGLSVSLWGDPPHSLHPALMLTGLIWLGVFLVSLAGTILLTRRREKSLGMPFWTPVKRRILATALPAFLAGVGVTAGVAAYLWQQPWSDLWMIVPPTWMLFYGLALWQVGQFSVGAVRSLGVGFLAAGVLSAAIPPLLLMPVITLGLTFGCFHIAYGFYVWVRHGG